MGMYTEYFINIDLVDNVPEEVLSRINESEDLFKSKSFYTPNTFVFKLTKDSIGGYSFIGKGDSKYLQPFEDLIAYLSPWIDAEEGTFLGYSRYEEADMPRLYVLKG
jgi:hypothetical protein